MNTVIFDSQGSFLSHDRSAALLVTTSGSAGAWWSWRRWA